MLLGISTAERLLVEGTSVMLALLDGDGRILHVNSACHELLGQTPAELVGREVFELASGQHVEQLLAAFEKCQGEQRRVHITHLIRGHRGLSRWCETVLSPVRDSPEGPTYVHLSCLDISSHHRLEEVLETSQALFHTILETASDAIVVTDDDGRVVHFNRAAQQLFGHDRDQVLGRDVGLVLPGGLASPDSPSAGDDRIELVARRRDGSEFTAEVLVSARKLEGQLLRTAIVRDVTRQRAAHAELDRKAHHDALTGLHNRGAFRALLDREVAAGARLALLFVDLDGFKQVNDRFGHEVGDEMLVQVARRIQRAVRTGDAVGRVGGDEFVVMLAGLGDLDAIERVAQDIRGRLAGPFRLGGHLVNVTASVGIARHPADAGDAEGLLRRADQAMYRAKQAGKNRVELATEQRQAGHA